MSTTITTKGLKELDRVYRYEDTALDEAEALDEYTKKKTENPDAIVTIEPLNCGEHYRVKVYKTEREKRTFYHKSLREMFDNLWDAIKT